MAIPVRKEIAPQRERSDRPSSNHSVNNGPWLDASPVHQLMGQLVATDWSGHPNAVRRLPGAARLAIIVGSSALLWCAILGAVSAVA